MAVNGSFSYKSDVGSLLYRGVKEEIVVYMVALICIAAPNPTVALNTVKKALSAV